MARRPKFECFVSLFIDATHLLLKLWGWFGEPLGYGFGVLKLVVGFADHWGPDLTASSLLASSISSVVGSADDCAVCLNA